MLNNTRRMNITWFAELSGGYHAPDLFTEMLASPDDWWKRIPNRRTMKTIQPFGRRPRPQPRTMPWAVALPILVWLIVTGEIKWR